MKSDAWLGAIPDRLADQFRFLLAADRLKGVVRGNRIANDSRYENTAEHSWHLALFALVLREYAVDEIDPFRVVQMLLLHDLVEIEAGDTLIYHAGDGAAQAAREQAAADKLFGLLPAEQGRELRGLWDEFEAAESADARFGKALDRLQPILLNHVVGGGTWTEHDIDEGQERRIMARIERGAPDLWAAAEAVFADAVAKGWLRAAPKESGDD